MGPSLRAAMAQGRGRGWAALLWLAAGCLVVAGLLSAAQLARLPAGAMTGRTTPAGSIHGSMASRTAAVVQLRAAAHAPVYRVGTHDGGEDTLADDEGASTTDQDPDSARNGTMASRAYSPRTGSSIHFCECARNEVTAAAEGGVVCKATRLRNALREAQRAVSAVCPVKAEVINIRQRTTCQMQQARHWMERRGLSYQQWQFTATRDEDLAQQDAEAFINKAKHKMMIAESLSAVASLSAVRHLLHAPGRNMSSLFYTRRNMWQLRGDSQEPFTNATGQYMPEELPLVEMPHCAVVGNSGVLLKHRPSLGRKIDQATVVVRVNQAPATKEYHDYVGSRTNIRVLNRKWTQMFATRYVNMLHKEDAGNMIVATRAQTKYFERLGAEIQGSARNATKMASKMLLLANHNLVSHGLRLLRAFRNGLQEATGIRFKGGDSPSSGFITTLLMMQMCKKTTLYGFSMGGCVGGCGRYHYFNNVPDNPRNHGYKGHTYANEGWLIKALHIMGTVCIEPLPPGLGPCGSRLGRRLTASGKPQRRYGGDSWKDTAALVNSVTADPRFNWGMMLRKKGAVRRRSRGGNQRGSSAYSGSEDFSAAAELLEAENGLVGPDSEDGAGDESEEEPYWT